MKPAKDSTPVNTGFYRFTDIIFEWHKALPDQTERSALKAFVSYTSLGNPSNPLWVDKEKGMQLFIGTLHSGKVRLLWSTKQVEYIRYWLHNMGYTRNLLPIPSSDILLTESEFKNREACYYKTPEAIKRALRDVDKTNSRLRGADTKLLACRYAFERVRRYWASKKGTWLSIDFEAYEYEHDRLTEYGWSMVRWEKDGEEVANEGHLIVKEHINDRNGKWVPEMRDSYDFGQSEIVIKKEFKARINEMLSECAKLGPVFLIFHDSSQDIKHLQGKMIEAPLEDMTFQLPENLPDKGTLIVDTSDMFCALEGDSGQKRSLEKMCHLLGHSTTGHMHNAGNDAHFTLLCLKDMASGNQIDQQQKERWSDKVKPAENMPSTMKVHHHPWEEDSDYSDLEGAYGRPTNSAEVEKHLQGLEISDEEF